MKADCEQPAIPAIMFEVTAEGLRLLNCGWEEMPGLSPNRWLGISRGGWRSLVPVEYHSEVEKLTLLPLSECYTVVEFPVYWENSTRWLLVFAASVGAASVGAASVGAASVGAATVAQPEDGKKVVGLVQDITREREWSFSLSSAWLDEVDPSRSEATLQPIFGSVGAADAESVEDLCHDLSGPLTSILMNCEMLLEDDCPPPVREKLAGIFSEAMQMNHQLRSHRRS